MDLRDSPGRRRVVHITDSFVRPSTPWIYDTVTALTDYSVTVLCDVHTGKGQFPFPDVRETLPLVHRYGRLWLQGIFHSRLGIRLPLFNPWASALRKSAPLADLYHAHFGPNGWRAVDAGLRPVITSFYGFDASIKMLLAQWREAYTELFTYGAGFIVEGPALRRTLIDLGAPQERVSICPLPADLSNCVWRPPRSTDNPVVLMAGRFVEKKGFEDGIQAFAGLNHPRARLTIMGDGPLARRLETLVSRLGLVHRTRFLPFAGRAQYRTTMANADIFLQPSRTAQDGDSEGGAPTTLLDAQAIGLPVITTDHADIPFVVDPSASEIAKEHDAADLTRALARVLNDPSSWIERSRRQRAHVERQHGQSAFTYSLRQAYDSALSTGRNGDSRGALKRADLSL